MDKSDGAFRTISEVSEWLDTPTYVLRFWESCFPQIKPMKRAGGRRYYRPEDMMLLGGIKKLLHFDELTIKATKNLLKKKGVNHVIALSPGLEIQVAAPQTDEDTAKDLDTSESETVPEARNEFGQQGVETDAAQTRANAATPHHFPTDASVLQTDADATVESPSEQVSVGEAAKPWTDLVPDMIRNIPYRIQAPGTYDAETLAEIKPIYHSLLLARNAMQQAQTHHEVQAR